MWQGSDTTAIFEISQHRNWDEFGHRELATVDGRETRGGTVTKECEGHIMVWDVAGV